MGREALETSMIKDLVHLLQCPTCHASRLALTSFVVKNNDIKAGVIICKSCSYWYPIDAYILEFLPSYSSYSKDRANFYRKYKTKLRRLGVKDVKAPESSGQEKAQQAHSDWYANNETQTYDRYASSSFWKSVDAHLFSLFRPMIKKNALLLDLGCGQGRSTFQLADLPIRIVAFDISKKLIRLARNTYTRGSYTADITFMVADASTMPFKNHCFDVVLSYGVLHHLNDPAKACREIARIVKSRGGVFFCAENNQSIFRKLFDLLQYVRPIWFEEAGSMPLISEKNLKQWFNNTSMHITCWTETYLPPHLVVLLPLTVAKKVLTLTDHLFSHIPWVNKQGGLIIGIGKT